MSSLADRLYPAAEPTEAPIEAQPTETPVEATPARSEVPANIAAERGADLSRTMYGGTTFVSELPDGSLPPEYDHAEVRHVAQDLGATARDMTMLRDLASYLSEPASGETLAGWETQAIADLNRLNVTQAELEDAKALVAKAKAAGKLRNC